MPVHKIQVLKTTIAAVSGLIISISWALSNKSCNIVSKLFVSESLVKYRLEVASRNLTKESKSADVTKDRIAFKSAN